MLAIPLFGDQFWNANQVVARGFGLSLDRKTFTPKEFREAVIELLNNDTYRRAIKEASAIFHSRKPPGERAADAVEHLLKFGSGHLRPHAAYELILADLHDRYFLLSICGHIDNINSYLLRLECYSQKIIWQSIKLNISEKQEGFNKVLKVKIKILKTSCKKNLNR